METISDDMREILFRAWHKKRKKYYEVLNLHMDSFEGMWATCKGYDVIEQKHIHIQIQPNDCIIEQYTGLKDKNGTKIFEGDIIELSSMSYYGPSEVVFKNGSFKIKSSVRKKTVGFGSWAKQTEITGNIHDQ